MALGSVASGEQRAWFLAVGLNDNTVRIISLDPAVRDFLNFYIQTVVKLNLLNDDTRTPLKFCV